MELYFNGLTMQAVGWYSGIQPIVYLAIKDILHNNTDYQKGGDLMNEPIFPVTQDGRYEIAVTDAGVYLSVWPAGNGGAPVEKTAIIQDLAARNISAFESDFLSTVIREAIGQPVLIVDSLPPQNGRYDITATFAGVYLSVWPPVNNGLPVEKATIIQDLTSQNILAFESDFISKVIKEAIGRPVLIVNSQPPQDGRYEIIATDAGVFLSVWPAVNGGKPVEKAAVIQDLTNQNLVAFESDFISSVIKEAIGQPVLIVNSQAPEDGRYEIVATDAGVYLSVWPAVNGGKPVKKATVIQDLTDQNFVAFEGNFIATVIKEALGKPVLVVNSLPLETGPNIRVKVRRDRLQARIDMDIPIDAPMVTKSQILDKLKEAGVSFGIDEQALDSVTEMRSVSDIVCASGIPPCDGSNASLKFHVDPECQGRPVEMEDGRVDFKEINGFLCVEEGQLLVEKIPATPGTPGTDVFGLPIPARPGKDIRMPVGKNVVCVDDWRLYAAIHGHLQIFLDKRINVIPVIVIDGDVDYATGNIDFKGSVIVHGSVQPEFYVKAGGNVEISGTICGGTVEASSIIVHLGIQGMSRSVIKARECVMTNFIENATVYADQEVIVSDAILNSSVFAGCRVIVEGRRGLVRGGRISAGEEIRAFTVGNQSSIVTDLEVSVNPFLKDELHNLRIESKKAEALYQELKQSLAYIRAQGIEKLKAEKQERYKKNEAEFNALPEQMEEMQQRISKIEEILNSLKPGRIRVYGVIYPGVKLAIGSLVKTLNDSLQYISFYAQKGEIKFTSLR